MSNTETKVWPIEDFPPELNVYELDGSPGTFRVALNGDEIGEGEIGKYMEHLGTADERLVVIIEEVGRPQEWDTDESTPEEQLRHFQYIVESLMRKANEIYTGLSIIEIDTPTPLVLAASKAIGSPERWELVEREYVTAFERIITDSEARSIGSKVIETTTQISLA